MFAGIHTALVTPFADDGTVDEASFRALVDRQFENGVQGVVPVGTTGESPTLDHDEHLRVIEVAVEQTAGRGLVIAGTGSNSTAEAIALTRGAQDLGAHAALLVAPYYNKPSQEGLFQHYKAIADATSLPLVLYSIPGRCGIEIGVETMARLAESCPNIVANKEAGGSVERINQLKAALPDDFELLSGDDSLTLPFMSVGALGVVSVASNLIPGPMASMVKAALAGNWDGALGIHRQYYPLFKGMLSLDTNPVPIKAALGLAGLCSESLRLPMVPLNAAKRDELALLLKELEIL